VNKRVTNIVFSKNRPLQLEGYLKSLYKYWSAELIQTVVIYKSGLFDSEYADVFSKFGGIEVIKEQDFHGDVMRTLAGVKTDYLLFGIDDVIFFDGFGFDIVDKAFSKAGDDIFGLHSGLALNLRKSLRTALFQNRLTVKQFINSIGQKQNQCIPDILLSYAVPSIVRVLF